MLWEFNEVPRGNFSPRTPAAIMIATCMEPVRGACLTTHGAILVLISVLPYFLTGTESTCLIKSL